MFVEVTGKKLRGGTFLGPLIGGGGGGFIVLLLLSLFSFIYITISLLQLKVGNNLGRKASISLRKCKLIVLGGRETYQIHLHGTSDIFSIKAKFARFY